MQSYMNKIFNEKKKYPLIGYGIPKKELKEIDNNVKKILENKYTVLGSCGLLIERKGFKQLIEFLRNNLQYAVVILGEGEDRVNLEKLIKEYNLSYLDLKIMLLIILIYM